MDIIKWLERKYPVSKKKVKYFFEQRILRDDILKEFKEKRFKIGVLKEDVYCYSSGLVYTKGTLFMYKVNKEYDDDGIWNGAFRTYSVFKCLKDGLTSSGYHSIDATTFKFKQILK